MRTFFKRHLWVHIWALAVLALFCGYWYGISSPAAANAVSAVLQLTEQLTLDFALAVPGVGLVGLQAQSPV